MKKLFKYWHCANEYDYVERIIKEFNNDNELTASVMFSSLNRRYKKQLFQYLCLSNDIALITVFDTFLNTCKMKNLSNQLIALQNKAIKIIKSNVQPQFPLVLAKGEDYDNMLEIYLDTEYEENERFYLHKISDTGQNIQLHVMNADSEIEDQSDLLEIPVNVILEIADFLND